MQTMTHSIDIPSWMIQPPSTSIEPQAPAPAVSKKEIEEKRYEIMFDRLLMKLEQGINLKEILRDDQREIDYDKLRRWILKDPQRKARYYEAQELGTEIIAAELLEIADGADGLEDVQRSKLRIEARQFLIKTWNRKRYGDVKTLEVNQSISITAALEQASQRLTGRIIDHEEE